jgi:hypothetical protein
MEPARREPVGLPTIVEFIGYAGAAVALTAASTVLGQTAGEGVRVVFDLLTAAVLLGAGWAIGGRPEPYPRMQSVFWFVSVLAVADLAGTLFGDVIGGLDVRMVVFVAGLISAAYSFGLWWMLRRSLQAIALILSGYVAVIALVVPDGGGFIFGPPDLSAAGFVTWLVGGGVFAMGWLGWLTPRRTMLVLGSILALFGPLLFLIGGERIVGEVLSLATAFALMAAGERIGERSVEGLGIAGTLIVASTIVGNHVDDEGWAIAVLVVGFLLLGAAIVLARGMLGGPPALGAGEGPPALPPAPPPEDFPPRVNE